MRDQDDQLNVVKIAVVLLFLLVFVCTARAYVNPDGGVCRYPVVARMFKMCARG